MALTITSVTRINGPACDHVQVVVDDEGTQRTFITSFQEVDALLAGLEINQKKLLVLLWASYRRNFGRQVTGVAIA